MNTHTQRVAVSRPNGNGSENPYRVDAEAGMAARLHKQLDTVPKKTAAQMGVTPRAVTRWKRAGKGSPAHRFAAFPADERVQTYLATNADPWRLVAHAVRLAFSRTVDRWSDQEVVDRLRELLMGDAMAEGEENAARFRRDMDPLDHAALCEADAAHDLEMAALHVERMVRRIPWARVLS